MIPKKAPPVRRGGIPDLLVVLLVVVAAWLRTPVGGLFDHGVAWARGSDADLPSLTAYLVTGPPPEVVADLAEVVLAQPEGPDLTAPAPPDGFPEPYRTAARLVLSDESPAEPLPEPIGEDAAVTRLDALWDGDPESTLEAWAIGAEARDRAVARARAAGERDPQKFAAHRAWLPDAQARRVDKLVSTTLALATVLDMEWPLLVEHRVTSPYGVRFHPVLKRDKFHDGVDLGVPEGAEVHAAQSGTVAKAGHDNVSGNFVVIDHGNGVRTSYCHLSRVDVEKGAPIDRGVVIGLSGNTGRSTGPHLHFTVRVGRGTVDPLRLRRPKDRPQIDEQGPGESS